MPEDTTTTTTPPDASTATATARLTDDERARVGAALRHVRAARCTEDDESIPMTWELRDDIVQDLTQAIEFLRRLVL